MTELAPLEGLLDRSAGEDVPLPPALASIYGRLTFPEASTAPYVIANFVQTLDGVVALDSPEHPGGGPISGFNRHDKAVMGILRAVADAVVVGAGTMRSLPKHIWTPAYVFPDLAEEYAELRRRLGKAPQPLNVIVTATGRLPGDHAVLRQSDAPVLIVTTERGTDALERVSIASNVSVATVTDDDKADPLAVVSAVAGRIHADIVLLEGGPSLMSDFFAAKLVQELFVTVAPHLAGRTERVQRPGLTEGRLFAPDDPRWGSLISVKAAQDHLFLRYRFGAAL